MSGPQSWEEMKSGIARRKDQVRRRNQQIKTLKKMLDIFYALSQRYLHIYDELVGEVKEKAFDELATKTLEAIAQAEGK